MLISTEIASIAKHVGEEKALVLLAKAGFDAWDFSMFRMVRYDWNTHTMSASDHPLAGKDYLAFARKLRHIGLDHGIFCNQSHAPFPTGCPEIRAYFQRAIECTAEAGGKICIIHPDNDRCAEYNADMYRGLLPFAKACGVKIATENMWDWDSEKDQASFAACATAADFRRHLDLVDDDFLVACLDLGHAEMRGLGTSAVEMTHTLNEKLEALHIHDNDRRHDSHQLPFTMEIDFDAIVRALKEIGYKGIFTLEADAYLGKFTADTVEKGVQDMADAAKRLARMFENA